MFQIFVPRVVPPRLGRLVRSEHLCLYKQTWNDILPTHWLLAPSLRCQTHFHVYPVTDRFETIRVMSSSRHPVSSSCHSRQMLTYSPISVHEQSWNVIKWFYPDFPIESYSSEFCSQSPLKAVEQWGLVFVFAIDVWDQKINDEMIDQNFSLHFLIT